MAPKSLFMLTCCSWLQHHNTIHQEGERNVQIIGNRLDSQIQWFELWDTHIQASWNPLKCGHTSLLRYTWMMTPPGPIREAARDVGIIRSSFFLPPFLVTDKTSTPSCSACMNILMSKRGAGLDSENTKDFAMRLSEDSRHWSVHRDEHVIAFTFQASCCCAKIEAKLIMLNLYSSIATGASSWPWRCIIQNQQAT